MRSVCLVWPAFALCFPSPGLQGGISQWHGTHLARCAPCVKAGAAAIPVDISSTHTSAGMCTTKLLWVSCYSPISCVGPCLIFGLCFKTTLFRSKAFVGRATMFVRAFQICYKRPMQKHSICRVKPSPVDTFLRPLSAVFPLPQGRGSAPACSEAFSSPGVPVVRPARTHILHKTEPSKVSHNKPVMAHVLT